MNDVIKPIRTAELPDVLRPGEIARLFRVSPRTVAKWIDNGLLAGYRLPGGSRVRRATREAVVAFMRQHQWPIDELLPPDRGPDDDPPPAGAAALGAVARAA